MNEFVMHMILFWLDNKAFRAEETIYYIFNIPGKGSAATHHKPLAESKASEKPVHSGLKQALKNDITFFPLTAH